MKTTRQRLWYNQNHFGNQKQEKEKEEKYFALVMFKRGQTKENIQQQIQSLNHIEQFKICEIRH